MLPSLARKLMMLTAVAASSLLLNARDAQAFGHRRAQNACYSSCYAPTYCTTQTSNCDTSCVDQCVVYRWDWCCCQWVVDSVYYGNLGHAEWQAWQRVQQLKWCGISAYPQCYVAKADVYGYNPWTCRWERYYIGLYPQEAAHRVWWLQCHGICAYSTCYLVPIYTAEAAPSSQAAPAAQAAPSSQAPAPPASPQAPAPPSKQAQ
jgi:hypothetical protein